MSKTTVVSSERLAELVELEDADNPGLLAQLIQVFDESSTKMVASLADAARAGDCAALEMHAHSMKSASLNLGAQQLGEALRSIEEKAARGQPSSPAEIDSIRQAFSEVLLALRAWHQGVAKRAA